MARYDWGGGRRPRRPSARYGYEMDYGRWGESWGGAHPGYGGYPASPRAAIHYGGYDAPHGGRPFMPEEAYRRHPDFDRPSRHATGRWPDRDHGFAAGAPMDDRYVEQSVRESLYGDTWIDPDRIEVEVDGGVVTLRGEVDDYMEARYAWDDAWESPGVRGVLNQITVRTDRPADDGGGS